MLVNLQNQPKKYLATGLLIALLILIPVLRYWEYFCCPVDINEYEQKYSTSQYVLGEKSPQKISDSELYVYAGYAYVRGEDPTTINFEHPPLAKYWYGLFHHFTGNPYLANLPLYSGILVLFYLLSGLVTSKKALRLLALAILGTFALIQVHLRYALLDLPLLFAYLLFFYGLLGDFKGYQKSLMVGAGLGIAATVKYPFPLVALLLMFLAIDAWRKKELKEAVVALITAVAIYFGAYIIFFVNNHNLFDWFAFEKYRLSWFMGKTDAPKFLNLQTLFTGQHQAWWAGGGYEKTAHWSVSWPLVFIGSVAGFVLGLKRKNYNLVVLTSFAFLQLLIYGLGAAAGDRFFITLLPFWVLGSVYLLAMMKEA